MAAAKKEKVKMGSPTVENRRARFDYDIIETIEAGIMLLGTEVKSLRMGKAMIAESYASYEGGAIWLINATITEYGFGTHTNHEPKRKRKLLLKKREIESLRKKTQTRGVTLVPLKMYFNDRGYVKVLLGVAAGKKQHEKRDTIKDRDWKRQQQRLLKNG